MSLSATSRQFKRLRSNCRHFIGVRLPPEHCCGDELPSAFEARYDPAALRFPRPPRRTVPWNGRSAVRTLALHSCISQMSSLGSGKAGESRRYAALPLLGLLGFALVVCSAYASQQWWRESGLRVLQARNEPRVEIIASALRSEINRRDHLTTVVCRSTRMCVTSCRIRRTPRKRTSSIANCSASARKPTRVRCMWSLATARSLRRVSLPGKLPANGRSLADRSYVIKALKTERSSYLGVDPESNRVRTSLPKRLARPPDRRRRDPDRVRLIGVHMGAGR